MKLAIAEVKPAILGHEEFKSFKETVNQLFAEWQTANTPRLKGFAQDGHPRSFLANTLRRFAHHLPKAPLIDQYDIYQQIHGLLGRNHARRLLHYFQPTDGKRAIRFVRFFR